MIALVPPQIISTRSWRLGTPGVSSGRFIFSQLWKLQVQDPGVGAGSSEATSLGLQMPASPPVSARGCPPVCSQVWYRCVLISSPSKITSQIEVGFTHMISCNLSSLFKALFAHESRAE